MNRLKIKAKIWLNVAMVMLAFILLMLRDQRDGLERGRSLGHTAEAVYPAAQKGQSAQASFRRTVEALGGASPVEAEASLQRADSEARRAIAQLQEIAHASGLSAARSDAAAKLAASIEAFLTEAASSYDQAPSGSGTPASTPQPAMQALAARTEEIRWAFDQLNRDLTADLGRELNAVRAQSERMRQLSWQLFAITMLATAVVVELTIRRVIMRPLVDLESDLAQERYLLQILLENIPDYIYFKDAQSRFIRVNKAKSEMLGLRDPSEALGRTEFDFLDPELAQRRYQEEQDIVRTGEALVSRIEQVGDASFPRWLTSTKVPVRNTSGQVDLLVCVSRDMTDWKIALEALQHSERSFRLLFAAIPHPVWVHDLETLEFIEVNDAAIQHYGYSSADFAKLHLQDIFAPEDRPRLLTALHKPGGSSPSGAWKHTTRNGQILQVEISSLVFDFKEHPAVLVVAEDVTERRRLELELEHAHRLEAVGQLAAGIAHEINTPIQYVGDNIHFLEEAFRDQHAVVTRYEQLRQAALESAITPELVDQLGQALDAADMDYLSREVPRAIVQSLEGIECVASIVRAMKAFAHPGHKDKAAADLNKALADALIVARNEIKYVADVETDFGELPPVVCLIGELNQVFLNVLINAADAIREVMNATGQRGRITVRTRRTGDQILIAIGDTGCGIPPDIASKIFDMFFTTKEVGRGSGQGLAFARAIVVDKHGGRIMFEPNQPQGTTFLLQLPIEPASAAATREDEEANSLA